MISLLNYQRKTEKTAKSVDEAKALALAELGITENEAIIEVLEEGSKGFLGLGAKDAKVRVTAIDVEKAPKAGKTVSSVSSADPAKDFLSGVFEAMGLDVAITTKKEDNSLLVEMEGDRMGLVIGKHGDTLDALQYLTSLVVNRHSDERVRVILDTENYRAKRQETLLALASRLADKVARTGKKHTLEPMNPYERRIIHSSLQGNEAVTTFSVGEEPYRKVVIAPKNAPAHRPHISSRIASEYRQQNHNKHKSFDEFLENNED